VEFLIRE